MGPTSYLKVPASTQCSLLKPFHHSTTNPSVPLPLPTITTDNQPIIVPLVIFGYPQDTNSKLQVLVQWEGLLPQETSWKDWKQLKSVYHLEDKVILQATTERTLNLGTSRTTSNGLDADLATLSSACLPISIAESISTILLLSCSVKFQNLLFVVLL